NIPVLHNPFHTQIYPILMNIVKQRIDITFGFRAVSEFTTLHSQPFDFSKTNPELEYSTNNSFKNTLLVC
ncbi:MAG: hypothetical protein ACTSUO_02370, partial [Candidatus Thorarchaeota archaeon]